MSVEVVMPQMGESITEGTVSKWLKAVGEKIGKDEPILEISTDKVDAEVPSPGEGVLLEIRRSCTRSRCRSRAARSRRRTSGRNARTGTGSARRRSAITRSRSSDRSVRRGR